MFRAARTLVASNSSLLAGKRVASVPTRSFFGLFVNKNAEIASDAEQQSGRRRVEMDMAAQGIAAYNREPIVPDSDAGTKEKPIVVLSGEHVRAVGFEDPASHQMMWFNLEAGNLHYVPSINLYFSLKHIGEPAGHH